MLRCFSHVQLFATLWTVARQAPLSMGFSRQEYWSACHALLQGIISHPGMETAPLTSPALAGGMFTTSAICSTNRMKPSPKETKLKNKEISQQDFQFKSLPIGNHVKNQLLRWVANIFHSPIQIFSRFMSYVFSTIFHKYAQQHELLLPTK